MRWRFGHLALTGIILLLGRALAEPPATAPQATITVDESMDDWKDVPVSVAVKPKATSSYGPYAVRIARDEKFVYALIEVKVGVRERFEAQVPTGRVKSGALGFLKLNVDGVAHRIWLPTGFKMRSAQGKQSFTLEMSYEVNRMSADGKKGTRVLTKEYPADNEFIGIGANFVELKIPMDVLMARPASVIGVEFDAF